MSLLPFLDKYRSIIVFLMFIMCAYLVFVFILYVLQKKLIYFPEKGMTLSPSSVGLEWEQWFVPTPDGVKLSVWWVPVKKAHAYTILFFHGNAGNNSYRVDILRMLNEVGCHTVLVDYRGYGLSTGQPSEKGFYTDAESVWAYMTREKGISPEKIILYGRSLGSGVAGYLANQVPARGLILDSSFPSLREVAKHHYPFIPVRYLLNQIFPVEYYLRSTKIPILMIHSVDDEIVPYKLARELADSIRPRLFVSLHGGHNTLHEVSRKEYIEALNRFLSILDEEEPR